MRPEEIAAVAPCSKLGEGIDATGGRPVRAVLFLRSGVPVFTALSLRVLLQRLAEATKKPGS